TCGGSVVLCRRNQKRAATRFCIQQCQRDRIDLVGLHARSRRRRTKIRIHYIRDSLRASVVGKARRNGKERGGVSVIRPPGSLVRREKKHFVVQDRSAKSPAK